MGNMFSDCRVFWKEFRRNHHTTGAILPSGRFLAAALSHFVRKSHQPKRILEVGPGTGAVTKRIIQDLGPDDRLDMVELNDQFVELLRERFETEPSFHAVAERAEVIHRKVEDLATDQPYDFIISGLPLNNFTAEDVEQILQTFHKLLAPMGTLSFFQYIAIRRAKTLVSRRAGRNRLRGITRVLSNLLTQHEIRRDWVWPNFPPAWVHHVRFHPAAS